MKTILFFKLKYFVLLGLCIIQAAKSLATGYSGDVIYFKNQEWQLLAKPIERDSILFNKLIKTLPKERSRNTSNWDGYTAYWMIKKGRLHLEKIEVEIYDKKTKNSSICRISSDSLKSVFADYYTQEGICATWLSGDIRIGQGEMIRYVHMAYDRNVETECVFKIKKGKIIKKQIYHNFKKEGLALDSIPFELSRHFPFNEFPELKGKGIFCMIKDAQISPKGKLIDVSIQARTGTAKSFIQDQNHPLIKAIKATIKAAGPWEVLYIHNKYCMEHSHFAFRFRSK